MAQDVQGMLIRIEATTAQLRRELETANAKVQASAQKIDSQLSRIDGAFDRLGLSSASLRGAVAGLAPAIAGLVTVETLRRAQQLGEEFTRLRSRVSRLSADTESAARAFDQLAQIANLTGAGLGDTVQLWESLSTALREMGANDAQVMRLTETLQKIGVVGGSSAADMSNALRQLGQALSGGVLRAEEFNSVLDGMPELAREIARGLGVPFGELRQLMLDGELTADKVLTALQSRAIAVDREFGRMPRTVAAASEALNNNLGRAISDLDRTIGASSSLVWFLDTLSKGIRLSAGDLTDQERLNELLQKRSVLIASGERNIMTEDGRKVWQRTLDMYNAEIRAIQNRRVQQQKDESAKLESSAVSATNDEYDKYLARLRESAALQGENTELARVRYDIESGELGQLTDAQRDNLIQYAKEKDAKAALEKASKAEAAARDKAAKVRAEEAKALQALLDKLLPVEAATREHADSMAMLDAALTSGTLTLQKYQEATEALWRSRPDHAKEIEQLQWIAALRDQIGARQAEVDISVAGIGLGDRAREEMQALVEVQQQYARMHRELARAQGTTSALPQAQYQERVEALRAAEREELAIVREGVERKLDAQGDWTRGAARAWQNYVDNARDVAGQADQLFTSAFSGMEDALVSFVTTGKASFADFTKSILADMARIAARQAITGLAANLFSSVVGGYMGGGGTTTSTSGFSEGYFSSVNAKGNAFRAGEVVAFANGGAFSNSIVSSPTLFPMSAGRTGLMGEAGPEAILPLTRAPDGSLGVRSLGGGSSGVAQISVQVNIASDGSSEVSADDGRAQQFGKELGAFVEQKYQQLLARDLRDGGQIKRAMAGR